jgi:hypothetical protein
VGAAVAAWPAVALVGSYELLMMVIRSSQVPVDGTPADGHDMDPLQERAAELFAAQLAADRVPSVRVIRAELHVGQARGQDLRDCDDRMRSLAALLGTKESSELLDRPLLTKGSPSVKYSKDRRRVLALEIGFLDLVGDRRDKSRVTQASKRFAQAGPIEWVNSAADCLALLRASHEQLHQQLESTSLVHIIRVHRNKQRLERADITALALGILLVDLKEIPELPNSYGIGAHIARLAEMA